MKFRIGVGKKVGGVYVGASETIGGGNGGGGCWLTGLAVLFFPITIIYLFIRWAYRKTQQQKATDPDSVWYKKTWGIVLMLILFYPVGIYLMWKYKKSWNLYAKIVVSLCAILIFIGTAASQIDSDDSKTSSPGISETEPTSLTTFMTTALTEAKTTVTTTVTTTVITTVKETEPPTEPEIEEEPAGTIDEPEELVEEEPIQEEPIQEEPVQEEAVEEEPVEEEPVEEEDPNDSVIVYYTKTGEKYHYENPCGRGTYYECTLSEAQRRGLEPCEKCVLH